MSPEKIYRIWLETLIATERLHVLVEFRSFWQLEWLLIDLFSLFFFNSSNWISILFSFFYQIILFLSKRFKHFSFIFFLMNFCFEFWISSLRVMLRKSGVSHSITKIHNSFDSKIRLKLHFPSNTWLRLMWIKIQVQIQCNEWSLLVPYGSALNCDPLKRLILLNEFFRRIKVAYLIEKWQKLG